MSADVQSLQRLYSHLNPDDPPVVDSEGFAKITNRPGLDRILLEINDNVIATTYLNLIPNLSRSAQPHSVIENVVVDQAFRAQGYGTQIMAATLEKAWEAGCYKAMLQTGSRTQRTHDFYKACGFSPDAKTAYLARPPS